MSAVLELTFLGTGSAYPSPHRGASCTVLRSGEAHVYRYAYIRLDDCRSCARVTNAALPHRSLWADVISGFADHAQNRVFFAGFCCIPVYHVPRLC